MLALEGTEYDRFTIDDADQRPLTLDEAIKKAEDLRRTDTANFYRVEPANEGHSTFRVRKVSASSVYANFFSHLSRIAGSYMQRQRYR